HNNHYKLLSDSSRGAGGNYTVSSVALKHTGVYVCRAEREKPAYKTTYSNKQPLWVTGVFSSVCLIISPNRTQHFTSVFLSLSCEDTSNSNRWTVRRYIDNWGLDDCSSSVWGSQTGSTCTINSTSRSDTGVYWCQSESGENYHPVNITVHSGVILESPVHPVSEGDTLTLHCLYQHSNPPNLRADFYKDGSLIQSQTTEMIISTVSKSHEGFYYCKHPKRGESPKSWISVRERPKAKVTIKPNPHVFSGETVTLRCDIDGEGVTSWQYSLYKDRKYSEQEHTFSPVIESHAGKYSCYGVEIEGSRTSQISDAVTLTVSVPRAVLSVSPQKWLTEEDPVTLICEVNGSSTGWTFSWYTLTVSSDSSDHYKLLSDSSRGAGGNYTVSSVALKHTGVYVCRAEREKTAYNSNYSNKQPLWVTGVSPPVSLIISPSRTQHFTSASLSLSCESQSNSDRWTVRRYTDWLQDCSSSLWGSQTGSTCTISYTSRSDTGVYWCQSESGENSHPVNITVHFGVILESPVHPVTEGDTLTLRCLYEFATPPNLRADFYKDGSLIQSQTTEMIISNVSKSHEGFYYCKHPERGESPKSWISVRGLPIPTLTIEPQKSLFTGDSVTLRCEVNQSWDGSVFIWTKDLNIESAEAAAKTIDSVKVSDGGEYRCRARKGEDYTHFSEPVTLTIHERPKAKVTIKPAQHVFRGETVTLRCDIDAEGVTSWQYSWYKNSSADAFSDQQEHTFRSVIESDAGKYSCYGEERGGSHRSHISDEVSLTVSAGVILESPVHPVTEGDTFTLRCLYQNTSSVLRADFYKDGSLIQNQTTEMIISNVSKSHEGFYYCKHPERGESPKSWISVTVSDSESQISVLHTLSSVLAVCPYLLVTVVLIVKCCRMRGVSSPVSLIISPSRTQHFTSASLSLSCEDQRNSDRWTDQSNSNRWTVRRYTDSGRLEDCSSSVWGSQTGSTCTISSTSTSDTGVYWCQSESGENSHPVNITVH
ncbi:hypothetical protein QQF64_025370, partial [Cirrhinus molitorella]